MEVWGKVEVTTLDADALLLFDCHYLLCGVYLYHLYSKISFTKWHMGHSY